MYCYFFLSYDIFKKKERKRKILYVLFLLIWVVVDLGDYGDKRYMYDYVVVFVLECIVIWGEIVI